MSNPLLTTAQMATSPDALPVRDAASTMAVLRFRAKNDPTKVGAAARAALELHHPEPHPDRATAVCAGCAPLSPWPCPTIRVMAGPLDLNG